MSLRDRSSAAPERPFSGELDQWGCSDRCGVCSLCAEASSEPPSGSGHVWEMSEGNPDNDEYLRWSRFCPVCGDRVTAFRGTAIYQVGSDPERLPHAVPLSGWEMYAICRGRRAAERPRVYPQAPRRRLWLVQSLFYRWLDARSLDQNEVARAAGISSGYMSQLVCGRKAPSAKVRAALLKALELEYPGDLFDYR